jgi:hypothetical protein
MDIKEITVGKSYACKFKVETMLDTLGRPAPNLSDVPIKGKGLYESIGVIEIRDMEKEMVQVVDEKTSKKFVVPFADIWDIDEAEFVSPLETD